MSRLGNLTAALSCLALLGACGSDPSAAAATANCNPNDQLERKGVLDVRDATNALVAATPYVLDISAIATGKTKDVSFSLTNSAIATTAQPVVITGVDVVETDDTGAAVTSHQFACLGPDGKDCAISVFPAMIPASYDAACAPSGASTAAQTLTVRYTRPPSAKVRHVTVSVHWTGDPTNTVHTQEILIDTALGTPKLSCTPTQVDFGIVAQGSAPAPIELDCNNVGTAAVQIQKIDMVTGTAWYGAATFNGSTVAVGTPWSDPAGIAIEAGSSLVIEISLEADKATVAQSATLEITSNDPSNGLLLVQLKANSTGPCLSVSPGAVDLGSVGLGQKGSVPVTLTNCGKVDALYVSDIALQSGASAGLAVTSPGGNCGTTLPTTAVPWMLPVGESCSVQVEYAPPEAGVTANATLEIDADGGATKTLAVTAKGVAVSCGSACFTLQSGGKAIGNSVVPQTLIALDGSCSTAAPGQAVATWNWTVISQPAGSYATFQPSKSGKNVTFQPNIAGDYTVQLNTVDGAGAPGCDPKTVDIVVVPDDKMHVELTWTTAGDKDPTDGLGTDMDLHLAHPDAVNAKMPDYDGNGEPDPWYNKCDCFVDDPVTSWGDQTDPLDDAVMGTDCVSGWGPENININTPQTGFTYTVGALYYFDKPTVGETGVVATDPASCANPADPVSCPPTCNGPKAPTTCKPFGSMGPSIPRVRVYLDQSATPQLDVTGPSMVKGDMWCVQQVTFHTNAFAPCKGAAANGVLLTPLYPVFTGTLPSCE